VWLTAVMFFQASLLLGYLYAHGLVRWIPVRWQWGVHGALMLGALFFLPIALPEGYSPPAVRYPGLAVVGLLALVVGLPFVILSANAPLLQSWFARSRHPLSHDPYFLYVASNFGSLLALLSYPLLWEPRLRVMEQARLWAWAFAGVWLLATACGLVARKRGGDLSGSSPLREEEEGSPSWRMRLLWLGCAFVPSSFLLGVTNYLTSNVTPVPLLWVIPLSVYLWTFMIAFARKRVLSSALVGRVVPLMATGLALLLILESSEPAVLLALFHLVVFGTVALLGHLRLAETRPSPSHLTEYYLWIALGGVLGGVFNGLLAPVIFRGLVEYPLALVLGCVLVPWRKGELQRWGTWLYPVAVFLVTVGVHYGAYYARMPSGWFQAGLTLGVPLLLAFLMSPFPLRFALSLGAVLLVAGFMSSSAGGKVLLTQRSFFGVHRVAERGNGRYLALIHGVILHGIQSTDPARKNVPLAYYYPTSPLGRALRALNQGGGPYKVGIVGLGTGASACYGRAGDEYVFFEIDPVVVELARDSGYFSYLANSRARIRYVLGDARITLAKEPDAYYDVLVLDAFSSDSIPAHLLTLEAVKIYLRKLKEDGILLFHISNKYLNLRPVMANVAGELGLPCFLYDDTLVDDEEERLGKFASTWVLMGKTLEGPMKVVARSPRWEPLKPQPGYRVWTDDFYDIVSVFRGIRD
jgi:SAM-dependent methyltransferase